MILSVFFCFWFWKSFVGLSWCSIGPFWSLCGGFTQRWIILVGFLFGPISNIQREKDGHWRVSKARQGCSTCHSPSMHWEKIIFIFAIIIRTIIRIILILIISVTCSTSWTAIVKAGMAESPAAPLRSRAFTQRTTPAPSSRATCRWRWQWWQNERLWSLLTIDQPQ